MKCQLAVLVAQALLLLPTLTLSSPTSPFKQTWDYILVGSGASGIPLASRLAASGSSVLLLERGPPSSGRWGGTRKPAWLEGTNLTRFDVPALAQYVWLEGVDNRGIFCEDVQVAAGCVLGGGTAVNAGQFYLPTPDDFDLNQPPGFRWKDVQSALRKARETLPSTSVPSQDGKSYLTNGTKIVLDALTNASLPNPYRFIDANEDLVDRNRVTASPEYFFLNGEKGGPMATYLVSASKKKDFKLQMNTMVTRVLRKGDTATGVEVEATSPGGISGTLKVTPGKGRVILSAGVFGSFKILLRSGIGPLDELTRLANHTTEATKLPPRKDWIDRPVGHNLDDSPSIVVAVTLPYIEVYDWQHLWNVSKDRPDIQQYLSHRSGPLAELQGSLGPVSWDKVRGADGRDRIVQWDVTSSDGMGLVPGGLIGFSPNLNLGKTSRGRLTLTPQGSNLLVNVSVTPFFNDEGGHDFAAVLQSTKDIVDLIASIPDSSFVLPPPGTPIEDYLRGVVATSVGASLTRNHWTGSTKMSASCQNKSAVVDSTTVVCGMRNLHVVDAGIVNGVPTANPQAMFVVVAERAAEVILKLGRY